MKTQLHRAFLNAWMVVIALTATTAMWGQVTLPGSSPYSENFNTTPGTSGTSYPTGWTAYNGTTVDNAMTVGNASSVSGGNYNFGSRIGILGSGSTFSPSSIVLNIANTTGKSGLTISYDVIKIKEESRSNSFNLEISTTSATTGFTAVTGGTYASGTIAAGTTTAYANLDLSAVNNNSGNVWIRWSYTELGGSGSRDAIALDNVVLSWNSAPTVTSSAATAITTSSATLNGTINANGATAAASFSYGLTTSYGSSIAATPSSVTGTSATSISAPISSLSPNTQYNFRAVATVGSTPTNGANASFYTLANVPGILTVDNAAIYTLDVTITATSQNSNPATTRYAIQEAAGQYVQASGALGASAVWRTAAEWGTVTVTGLTAATDYTFAAKARNNAGTPVETAFGAGTDASTLENTLPTLTAGTLDGFGSVCVNVAEGKEMFTLNGINLTAGDITVGPLDGYTFSTTEFGTYTATLAIPQTGTLTQDIWVTFAPTIAGSYNGNIPVSGGDATSINIAATGSGINTQGTVTTNSAVAGSASTAAIEGEVTAQGCTDVTARGIVYSATTNPVLGGSGTMNVADAGEGTGEYTVNLTGLTGGTTYYAKAYATNDGGTNYGSQLSFTTSPVVAPVATDATDENHESFVANWNAADGAASYRLDVSTSPTFGTLTPATDLFFSEYVEGSSTNKYLEIFNGTGTDVNLADYRVRLYSNGSTSASGTSNDVQLSGTLANGAVVVIRNSGASIYSGTAAVIASVNFNGNDAVALYKISTAANVDIFGNIGNDPGSAWTSTSNTTVDKTLVRKATVTGGVTVDPSGSGFPTLEAEWTQFDQNTVSNLGSHTYAGTTPSFLPGYENLAVTTGTSQLVSGLSPVTTYYYRVRAVGGNTSANSNTITAVTTENTDPQFTATELPAFGDVCINGSEGPESFTITGAFLTADNVTVGPLAGYSFSITEEGTYTDSLDLTQDGDDFEQIVYVKFEPTAETAYAGNIAIAGGGADSINIAAAGTGVDTAPIVVINDAEALTASTAIIEAEVTLSGCTALTERGVVYSTFENPVIDGEGVIKVTDSGIIVGTFTTELEELAGATTYYVRAYAINNAGTSYSNDATFVTGNVIAPVAVDAIDVTAEGFIAFWNNAEGAVSYRIDVSTSSTFGTTAAATDLFFSEYVEGSSTNKYLEIYNGTGANVDLSDYRVRLYSNGSPSATGVNDVQLSGTLANDAVLVIKNSGATIYTGTATVVSSVNFNGNDAVALYRISTATNVDIIGKMGEDPGSAWTSTSNTTVDKTLVRKSFVTGGVTTNPASGFPTLESEWEVLNQNVVTGLGSHTYAGIAPSFVEGYEDFEVASGITQEIEGLEPETTYYYRVRAVAGNVSGNSNTIVVTTGAAGGARMAMSVEEANSEENQIMVYKQDGVLTITSIASDIKSVNVFDITGKQLFASDAFNQKEVRLQSIASSGQMLIVKVGTVTNENVTKKVVH
ncbi:lamin tail domain-containing protein [Flavobacterium sp. MFBS3-15]|uniref:lamin tail domain-containing protein n=1 Tax=Flavobacterium sp. MFBS3-15 TaxID=2989816 RepID=UPI00223588BA|nr:lamin tail domain-containing protein [Flavobacterium sp. MFBS3-15]MCW4468069.1 lamin tail domain-containing protein [Flavobacterium sp. MFBS3-15]